MKRLVAGVLAHVDAGKTTLCESMLYLAGRIRKLGRVDHGDTYLDTHALERARGITIFSKQASLTVGDTAFTLLDTPGHVDFSAEMERVLQVLDYAVLVISGTDGVQAHTKTLWRLLARYRIPTFLFITKMDLAQREKSDLLGELRRELHENCVAFGEGADPAEDLAVCDDGLLERYLKTGIVETAEIVRLIRERKAFPCYFGSGLKSEGVEAFLDGLERYTAMPEYPQAFGARVYKVARDSQGNRMTYLKVTGGKLTVRMPLIYTLQDGAVRMEEKISQIRIYSGAKYEAADSCAAGEVCAVLGLTRSYPGQSLGQAAPGWAASIEPTLSYRIFGPKTVNVQTLLEKLRLLEEEDPQLHILWDEQHREIHAQLMGEMQVEILQKLVQERFGMEITFGEGSILYRETISNTVRGVGHYEPLRHYAEVVLRLEPLQRGQGLVFTSLCSEDMLDRNWQQLILTHLKEKQHSGVLIGAPITDMKITLLAGKAHLKHTEGGDFRQATYRAVRQGLMQAQSVLLEPYCEFELDVPAAQVGRAITDIRSRHGECGAPVVKGELSCLTGRAPVAALQGYSREVAGYTHGQGRLNCWLVGYAPCHNTQEVLDRCAYDPERDLENSPDSVFCVHGAGTVVKWDRVPEQMHLGKIGEERSGVAGMTRRIPEKEMERILERTLGPIKRPEYGKRREEKQTTVWDAPSAPVRETLIVDGYNVIFDWEDLKKLSQESMDAARHRLMDMLCNYCGWQQCSLTLVFDAYQVEGGEEREFSYHGIRVVYTKQDETADMYVERLLERMGKNESVHIVTSDALIQLSAVRSGVLRTSAREFRLQVDEVNRQIAQALEKMERKKGVALQEALTEKNAAD